MSREYTNESGRIRQVRPLHAPPLFNNCRVVVDDPGIGKMERAPRWKAWVAVVLLTIVLSVPWTLGVIWLVGIALGYA